MKKILFIAIAFILLTGSAQAQNVFYKLVDARSGLKVTGVIRIGTDTLSAQKLQEYDAAVADVNDSIALVEAIASLTFVIMPHLTTTEINNLTNVVEGTFIYDSALHKFKYYDGSVWKLISTD